MINIASNSELICCFYKWDTKITVGTKKWGSPIVLHYLKHFHVVEKCIISQDLKKLPYLADFNAN